MEIRHLTVLVSDLAREADRQISPPLRKVVSAAVITNPFAGKYVEDLAQLIELGAELSKLLSDRAVAALEGASVHSYGKAAIVGTDGELEHAAAILHPNFGQPLRDAIGGGKSLIPSAKKEARRERRLIFRYITKTRHLCALILMRLNFELEMHHLLMKFSLHWQSVLADGRFRESVDYRQIK